MSDINKEVAEFQNESELLTKYQSYYLVDKHTGLSFIPFIATNSFLSTLSPSEIQYRLELLKYSVQ